MFFFSYAVLWLISIAFLVIHGLLHLHGYDHMNEEEEKIMFKKQEEILERLNYRR